MIACQVLMSRNYWEIFSITVDRTMTNDALNGWPGFRFRLHPVIQSPANIVVQRQSVPTLMK